MTIDTLKERIEPYLSVRVFGLTLGLLLGLSVLGVAVLALSSGHQEDIEASVTMPLGEQGEQHAVAEQPAPQQDVTPGQLSPSDMAVTEPTPDAHAVDAHPADAHPETTAPQNTATTATPPDVPAVPAVPAAPEKKPPPPIEDAVAGVHESTPFGMVPVIRKTDSLTAYQAYRVPYTPTPDAKAIVSLVMVDFGLSKSASDKAVANLPQAVTFSLSPYSNDAQKTVTGARQGGHEVWLSLPIQHEGYGTDDSGNQTILVNAGLDQNKSRLLTSLGKATGYAGVIDTDTPAFADAAADLENIYSMITDRGLALAQGNPKDTLTGSFAISHKAPFIQNDLWIDQSPNPADVQAELEKLKQIALNGNIAIGFFHPYPAVIEAIKNWNVELQKDKIELAPLSAAIEQKNLKPAP